MIIPPPMHNLGSTRSAHRRDHLLQTPDTFVRTPLPGLVGGAAVVHIGPAAGAAFTQFTVEFAAGSSMEGTSHQRFLYVLEGELTLDAGRQGDLLTRGSYAYLPALQPHRISTRQAARAVLLERAPMTGSPGPGVLIAHEDDSAASPLAGDPDVSVRTLLPDHPQLNFAVNTMTYQPGAALPMVEVHVMEHGLLMLEGGGIYRLGDAWYPVSAGDFVWMAPFCPQWFGAIGKQPAKYLIYKDWNQHPMSSSGQP